MPDRPNILLVTLDSVRPDHLGCYGYRGTETPQIDRLAAEGVRFTAAYTQAPNTWVAHASLLTGCIPPRHGLRWPLGRVRAEVPTLAELLRAAGYATFGLPALSLLSRESGFARGLETYGLEGLVSEFSGAVHFRPLGETLRLLREWLAAGAPRGAADRPVFLWVHYFGTHVAQGTAAVQMFDLPAADRARYSPYAQCY
ncbi:MAG: sulfatase-like hydrolase/transferase, partial [Pirellulales bacterium]